MIRFEHVSKEFRSGVGRKRVQALIDLDLEIPRGEVFGFLGPNGAGKSTAIKTLLHLIRPDCGTVTILGQAVSDPEVRQHVGYLPENPYFYDYLTAEELLWFGGKSAGMAAGAIRQRSAMLLERFNLSAAAKRRLSSYSKGMVQRAGLALALIHDPQVAILDEPMSGLDPLGRKMVADLILELKAQGKTVFFSTHILSDIERICDRAGIIVAGRLRVVDRLETMLAGTETLEEIFLREVTSAGGSSES